MIERGLSVPSTSGRRAPAAALGSIPLLLVAVACGTPLAPPAGPIGTPACGPLTELQCILSGSCTLALVSETPADYVCRDAANACEAGFIQRTGTQAECESREGCQFVPGFCYCPPDLTCVCGGGPPPQCVPAA